MNIQVAHVAVVSPLQVRVEGATSNSPVSRRTVLVPADIAVGQRVVVAVLAGQLTFLGRWETV